MGARIVVEDKGIGIPKELLPRVCDVFFRGDHDHDEDFDTFQSTGPSAGNRPAPDTNDYEAPAAWFASPGLPPDLFTALEAIERLVVPENSDLIRDRLRYTLKNNSFPSAYSDFRKAVDCWLFRRRDLVPLLPKIPPKVESRGPSAAEQPPNGES